MEYFGIQFTNKKYASQITKRTRLPTSPPNPVSDYVYMSDLNTRLCVSWKTLPNLNFKLKFQTQISNTNLNLKTKSFLVLPGNPGLWEIYSKGKSNKSN